MKRTTTFLSLLLIIGLVFYSFYSLMPQAGVPATAPADRFSSERALLPLKEISKKPHYYGSEEHHRVRAFLKEQLQQLGLETEIQEGFVLNTEGRALTHPKNIVARLKGSGTGSSLVLLSHYDSALVPSNGASDAGSGVVTILESLRAYLASGAQNKNAIIVVFSDAEEIGLDGAKLFVNEHPWAKNARLVLNFEARGSGGQSNMILETNGGNAQLVQAFIDAGTPFPVASSLMYSVYKMLPNDTDSTIFREDGDIDSFFFAFIDDHYDYHTANDTFENLDVTSLQHQGSYLLPLLHHFAAADLSALKAETDDVYFNLPLLKMVHYPFSWILPLLLVAFIGFIALIFYGFSKRKLVLKAVGKGFLVFFSALLLCGLAGFFGWRLLLAFYPHYAEIQHGFTYNGHWYIGFFVFLCLATSFGLYAKFTKKEEVASIFIAPITFWLLINTAVLFYLKGAGFFIIPVYFGLFSLFLLFKQNKPQLLLMSLLAAPVLFLFAPLIQFFPVGLGLKMLVISCVFTVLVFGMLLPVFGFNGIKKLLAALSLLTAVVFLVGAHTKSDFSETRQKPNSLLYYLNADTQRAYWLTYDAFIDEWTQNYLGDSPEEASQYIPYVSGSKYASNYTFAAEAPVKDLSFCETEFKVQDTVDGAEEVMLTLTPQRKINQISVYVPSSVIFEALTFNTKRVTQQELSEVFNNRNSDLLIRYYVADNEPLEITYRLSEKNISPVFTVMEYSFDLMEHPLFTMDPRPPHLMPKPFIVTDAVVIKKTIAMPVAADTLSLQ